MGAQRNQSDFRTHARRAAELVLIGAQMPSDSMGFAEVIAEAHREIGLAANCQPSETQLHLLYEASTLLHPDTGLRSARDLSRAYDCLRTAASSTFWLGVWQFITLPFSIAIALVRVLQRLVTQYLWTYVVLWGIIGVVVVALVWNSRSAVLAPNAPTIQPVLPSPQVLPTQTPIPLRPTAMPSIPPTPTPVPVPPTATPPLASTPTLAQPVVARAHVVRVVDGDTLDVQVNGHVERVRLLEVDTPERGCPLFETSTVFVRERVAGKQVALRFPSGTPEWDVYERLLAEVLFQRGGRVFDLGSELLEAGLAMPYVPGGPDCLPPG